MPTITGRVFLDTNGDNTERNGGGLEPGVAGITLQLFNQDQQVIATTTSAADGSYSFPGLPNLAGFAVRAEAPVGFVFVEQFVGDDRFNSEAGSDGITEPVIFSPFSSDTGEDVDIGLRPDSFSATITGRAFYDADGSLSESGGDRPAANVIVALVNADGEVYDQTQTDANGNYAFNAVGAGFNVVAFVSPFNGIPIARDAADDTIDSDVNAEGQTEPFFVAEGATVTNVDAGYAPGNGSISGRVYLDNDGDNTERNGANGIEDPVPAADDGARVVAVLYDERSNPVAQQTVDANGEYTFENVIEGTYAVRFVSGFQLQPVTQNVGAEPFDSDIDEFGFTEPFTLGNGQDLRDVDGGFTFPGSGLIVGRAFFDADGSRSETPADTGVSGVTVQLVNDLDVVLGTTVTGADGSYVFSGVGSGAYGVKFVGQPGIQAFGPSAGDPATNSDADQFGNVEIFFLDRGEQKLDLDAGFREANGSITGRAFLDTDGSDSATGPDQSINGLDVVLLDDAGNVIDQTVTNEAGIYRFEKVASGSYRVEFLAPYTLEAVGKDRGDDNTDSDINSAFITDVFSMGIDETKDGVSAGFKQGTSSVAGRLFFDEDNDGTERAFATKVDKGVNEGTAILKRPDGEVLATTALADDGSYRFDTLGAGDYVLEFDTAETQPIAAFVGDTRFDSQVFATTDPATGETVVQSASFFVNTGTNITDFDAGFVGARDTSLDVPPIRSFQLAENSDNLQATSGQLSANASRAVEVVRLDNGATVLIAGSAQGGTNGIASYRLDSYENGPSYGEIIGTETNSGDDIAARTGFAGDNGPQTFQRGYTFVNDMASVTLDNGRSYVYSADYIFGGIGVTEINPDGSLRTEDNFDARGTDPLRLETVEAGGQSYLIALGDGFQAPLAAYRIDQNNGRLSQTDAEANVGFGAGQNFLRASTTSAALDVQELDNGDALVVAGGNGGGISLFLLNGAGQLNLQNARGNFQAGGNSNDPAGNNLGRDLIDPGSNGISNVDGMVFGEINGQTYVFAGGSNRDVAIFRIDPDSRGDGTYDLTLVGKVDDVTPGSIGSMEFVQEGDTGTLVIGGESTGLNFFAVNLNGNGTVGLNLVRRFEDDGGQTELRNSTDIDEVDGILVSSSNTDNGVAIFTAGVTPEQPPVARPDSAATLEGDPVTIDVLANDQDNGVITIIAASVVQGAGEAFVDGNAVRFEPAAGFEGEALLSYTIRDDAGFETSTTVTVTVDPQPNAAPEAANDAVETRAGEPVTIDVLANDSDPENEALTITDVNVNPTFGSAEIVDNKIVFTPAANVVNAESAITYTIADPQGASDTASVTITVTTPPNQAPDAVNDVATTPFNTAITLDVLANDSDPEEGPLTVQNAVVTPSAGTADVVDGQIVFTPAAGFSGDATIIYQITDEGGLSDTATATVTVEESANTAPEANFDLVSLSSGQTIIVDATANDTDPENDALTITDVKVSSGAGTAEIVDNQVEFTAAPDFTGFAFISYEVSDAANATDRSFVLAFVTEAVNTAPTAVADTAETMSGDAVTIDVLANDTDPEGDVLTLEEVSVPSTAGTAEVVNNRVVFTANEDFVGEANFTYVVSDEDGLTDTGSVTVTVTPPPNNNAPDAQFDFTTGTNTQAVTIDALANDSDPDGDPLTITDVRVAASAGTAEIVDGQVVYTAAPGYTGFAFIIYEVQDDKGASATSFIAVRVSEGEPVVTNTAPNAVDDAATTTESEAVEIDLLDNDSDPEGDALTLASVAQAPEGEGSVAIVDNKLVFTPTPGFVGTVSLDYVVEDEAGLSDTASVEITVDPAPNTAPVALNDVATTGAGEQITIDVLSNDTDAEGALSIAGISQPTFNVGTVEVVDNAVVYTPLDGFDGSFSFGYEVEDAGGLTDTATVTVTVEPAPNLAPTALDDEDATLEGLPVLIDVLANDTDPEGDTLTITDVQVDEAVGEVQITNGLVGFAPAPGFFGDALISYEITDEAGNTDTASVAVEVIEEGQDELFLGTAAAETFDGEGGNDFFLISGAEAGFGDTIIGGTGADDTTDLDILDLRGPNGAQRLRADFEVDAENDAGSIAGTIQFLDADNNPIGEVLTFSGIEAIITDSETGDFQAFFEGSRYAPIAEALPGNIAGTVASSSLFDVDLSEEGVNEQAAKLVEIDTELENQFVSEVLGFAASTEVEGFPSFWLGINDADGDGTFTDQDGAAITDADYQNWAPGQPDGEGGYVVLTPEGTWEEVSPIEPLEPGFSPIVLGEWELDI